MVEAVGLFFCIWLLFRVDVRGFVATHRPGKSSDMLIPTID